MYYVVEMSDVARLPPQMIGRDPAEVAEEQMRSKYVGRYLEDAGLVLEVLGVKSLSPGRVIISSPSIYYRVDFEALTFLPKREEVIEGEIKAVLDYGAMVTIGPIDGFIHISQLGDDVFVLRSGVLQGRRTKMTFRRGDVVRAKVSSVSGPRPAGVLRGEPIVKVALNCRTPGLGKVGEGGLEGAEAKGVQEM